VVWNRDLVTVKNILPALRETRRVLLPGGLLVVAVPTLAALHNRRNHGDFMRGRTPFAVMEAHLS
jgi:predicted SAM-dependent methyltransferase